MGVKTEDHSGNLADVKDSRVQDRGRGHVDVCERHVTVRAAITE